MSNTTAQTTSTKAVELLAALGITKPSLEQIATAEKTIAAANVHSGGTLSFKVGEKKGVSVYGLQRNPVTLYKQQWERLLAPEIVAKLTAFITEHEAELAVK